MKEKTKKTKKKKYKCNICKDKLTEVICRCEVNEFRDNDFN